jgi:ATP-binding cassette subfamily C (CFTR/MRP) protein 1
VLTIGSPSRPGVPIHWRLQLLFSGAWRSNLDPFDKFDDAKLWDALRWSYPVENTERDAMEGVDPGAIFSGLFTLGTIIENEGRNLSVGLRSLVSPARALVKDTKVDLGRSHRYARSRYPLL